MVEETDAEVIVTVETTAEIVGCPACGTRAEAQDRIVSTSGICPASGVRPAWSG